MPPKSPPLTMDAKFVCEVVACWDAALRNTSDAVHPRRIYLVDAVPVNSRPPIGHEIVDMNSHFTNVCGY